MSEGNYNLLRADYIIDAVYVIVNSKYNIIKPDKRDLLDRLLFEKIAFINTASGEPEASSDSYHSKVVGYSYDTFVIPNEMTEDEKRLQIMRHALRLATLRVSRLDDIITVKSGYEIALFERNQQGKYSCIHVKNIGINNIARRVYSKYLDTLRTNPGLSLDAFVGIEWNEEIGDGERAFLICSAFVGNEIFFEAFIKDDTSVLDEVLRQRGTGFADLALYFEKGLDVETVRRVVSNTNGPTETLTGEVFERFLVGIDAWLVSGIAQEQQDSVRKLAKEYFVESSFGDLFGSQIDVQGEIQNIKDFYDEYFRNDSKNKRDFLTKVHWSKQYKPLKKESYNLAVKVINQGEIDTDTVSYARGLMAKVEKLNHQLEREVESIQKAFFKDIKEIFLNCMFASTGDKSVLGKEIGELNSWFDAVNKLSL